MKNYQIFIILFFITGSLFSQSGCVTYRGFSEDRLYVKNKKTMGKGLLYVNGGSMFGGARDIKTVFKSNSPFKEVEYVTMKPGKGWFVNVKVDSRPPSVPAMIFGYLSIQTLTILPVWSTKDGYNVIYEIFKDGERVKSFSYRIKRHVFVWLPLLPFAWVNFMTYHESDAFKATTYQFFIDSQKIFLSNRNDG